MNIPTEIKIEILKFIIPVPVKFHDLIDKNNIDWDTLTDNPKAIPLIEKNLDKLTTAGWHLLTYNEKAIHIIDKNRAQIRDPYAFSCNPNAYLLIDDINIAHWPNFSRYCNNVEFLEKHIDKLNWDEVSANPYAIPIIEKNLDKVNWSRLCENKNAISILEKNLDKITIDICTNENALKLIEQIILPNLGEYLHEDFQIIWCYLSGNPSAIHILEKNLDYLSWSELSTNPNAVNILKANIDKVYWAYLVWNSNPKVLDILEAHKEKWSEWQKRLLSNPIIFIPDNEAYVRLLHSFLI